MEKVFIWGTGFLANRIFERKKILDTYDVLGFIDNKLEKQGTTFLGKIIYAPEVLKEKAPCRVVVLTYAFDEIKNQIKAMFPAVDIDIEKYDYFDKRDILRRYSDSQDEEVKQILKYIKKNDLDTFNYDFVSEYRNMPVEVEFDDQCGMHYVMYKEHRMYMSKELDTKEKVANYYRSILLEQDVASPHRYLDDEMSVDFGDIVVDVGVAEGNFSLDIIDRAKKIYMIEVDENWIEALKLTFKDYMNKVVIINRYASSMDEGKFATLDALIQEPIDFLKMDIEGSEWEALLGAKRLIGKSKGIECCICSYHRVFDETLIKSVLQDYGFECSTSKGYMWYNNEEVPEMCNRNGILCRALVRGKR